MLTPLLLAIDIGKSGGLAWKFQGDTLCEKMPATESEVLGLLRELKGIHGHELNTERNPPVAYVEKVGGFIGNAHPGSRMFNFGEGYGFIKGVLQCAGWRLVLVRPQDWQKGLGLSNPDKLPRNKWKNKLKDEAQRLFPTQRPTLATADALLILEYAGRIEQGKECQEF